MGSTITPFRFARKVSKVNTTKCNIYQEQFHRHFNSNGHNEMEDWKINIIDRAENVLEIRHRESYWRRRLDTFIHNGLNEHFVSIPLL